MLRRKIIRPTEKNLGEEFSDEELSDEEFSDEEYPDEKLS
jgi:hypothetical protein